MEAGADAVDRQAADGEAFLDPGATVGILLQEPPLSEVAPGRLARCHFHERAHELARAEAADRVLRAVVDVAEEREPEKPLPTHAAVEAVQRLRAELERVRWSEKEQRVRADRAEKERDAALAAVDAVRADYAPRQEPPTAEEVRALARLWPHHDGAAVVLLRVLSRTGDRVAPHAVSVIVENDGTVEGFAANDMDKLHRADGWRAECPDGPVAWSHLAAMVARGGDRG